MRDGITCTDLATSGQKVNLRYRIRVWDPHSKRYETKCFANEREGMTWARGRKKEFLERRATAVQIGWKDLGSTYITILKGVPRTDRHIAQVQQVIDAVHAAGARDITDPMFPDIVQRWLSGLRSQRKWAKRSQAAGTALKYKFLIMARAICQLAVERGNPLYNPLAPIRLAKPPKTAKRIFFPHELSILVSDERRPDPWWWFAVLGVYTGMRKTMALNMGLWHFRNNEGFFPATMPGNKTERDIIQPLQPELAALLAEVPSDLKGPIVGWAAPHILEMSDPNISNGFQDYVRRCGLDAKGRGYHALRHSVAAIYTAQGNNTNLVQDWLGHDSPGVSKDYSRSAERVRPYVAEWPRGRLVLRGSAATPPHPTASPGTPSHHGQAGAAQEARPT